MSDISSLSNNMLRITGLATGMDTDSMVKKMMAAESLRLDKMKQDRQYIQWRQDGLRDVIKDLRDLRQSYLLIDSPADTNMIKSGTYSGSSVTVTDANNSNNTATLLTATALPGAVNGTSTVKVNQIAKSAMLQGGNLNKNSASTLNGGSFVADDWSNKTITFTVNGNDYKATLGAVANDGSDLQTVINSAINSAVNNTTNAVGELQGKINASVQGNTITFNSLTDNNIRVTSDITELSSVKVINPTAATTLSDLGMTADTTFTIKQGSKESADITLKSTDTIQDAINKIYNTKADKNNTSSNAATLYSDIQIGLSELTGSLTIQTRNTGSNQSLQISGGLSVFGIDGDAKTGQDAKVEITPAGSSTSTTITKPTNNFTIDNMTYNLVKDPNGAPYTVNLTIKPDSQEAVKKIKAFVDKYNDLVQKISDKISEKKNYDYKPLTDDQRSSMKDDQIKTWEDKAKQGVLKNDGDLQNILNTMRSAFMDSVKSAGMDLKDIGIETYGSYEAATKPGQMQIDETKLKNALETRGDQVMKIFTASTNSIPTTKPDEYSSYADDKWQDKYKYDNMGIFKRIENIINTSSVKSDGNLLKKAGYQGTVSDLTNSITKQLNDQDKAISEMNKKLADKQEKYYQMFAKLETAMNNMNAQQSWLAQQLGGK
ncbi:MAG: flagellar filament capping protein FliD [Clostridiaceae bacterium]|nr:flagellar filament capping protein FliD [Clostridiaceae bacterium]